MTVALAAATDAAGMSDLATLPILLGENAQPTCEPSAGRCLRFRRQPAAGATIFADHLRRGTELHAA
jgi:hypothetical protein